MTDSADTFFDAATGTWSYMFYDHVIISDSDVYTSKSAFNLKDGVISYRAFAVEHTLVENGARSVSYTDAEGNDIIAELYLESGNAAFKGAERSNTSFEWLTLSEAKDFTRLVESYKVFMGERKPTEVFPVPAPAAFAYPEATPAPSATPTPTPSATPKPTPTPDPDSSPARTPSRTLSECSSPRTATTSPPRISPPSSAAAKCSATTPRRWPLKM